MTTLWSFDFGETTGIARGFYGPTTPYGLEDIWEVQGGLEGFRDWWWFHMDALSSLDTYVAEKFALNPGEIHRFLPDIVGVPLEGALFAWAPSDVVWQTRDAKKNVPDSILKKHGLWSTGDGLSHTDARDAMDAVIHALAYLKAKNHRPTLDRYFREF